MPARIDADTGMALARALGGIGKRGIDLPGHQGAPVRRGAGAASLHAFPAKEKTCRAWRCGGLRMKALQRPFEVIGGPSGNGREPRLDAFAEPDEVEPLLKYVRHGDPSKMRPVQGVNQSASG
ncbi:hypothetical protein D3C87_1845990 [compost metagenome]